MRGKSRSRNIYIYIYIYMCVCVCVCVYIHTRATQRFCSIWYLLDCSTSITWPKLFKMYQVLSSVSSIVSAYQLPSWYAETFSNDPFRVWFESRADECVTLSNAVTSVLRVRTKPKRQNKTKKNKQKQQQQQQHICCAKVKGAIDYSTLLLDSSRNFARI